MVKNSIRIKDNRVDVAVSVYVFKEDDIYIVYCPSLDLSGYDRTEESVKADFNFVLKNWITDQLEAGTLKKDLAGHGWTESRGSSQEPGLEDLMRRNHSELSKVLSLPEYVRTNMYAEVATC